MNYDEARQIADGEGKGGWRWTTMRDGRVRTAQPCIRIDEPFDRQNPYKAPDPANVHLCPPHATREEAERHFYDHSLGQVTEGKTSNWMSCEVCGAPTKGTLGNDGMHLYFGRHFFCDEHRTKEELTKLKPFQSPITLIHS